MEEDVALLQLYHAGARLFDEIEVVPNLPPSVRRCMLERLRDTMYRVEPPPWSDPVVIAALRRDEAFLGAICAIFRMQDLGAVDRIRLLGSLMPPPPPHLERVPAAA